MSEENIVFNTKFDDGTESSTVVRCNIQNPLACRYRIGKNPVSMRCEHPNAPEPGSSSPNLDFRTCKTIKVSDL